MRGADRAAGPSAPWLLDRRALRHRVRVWMPSTAQTVGEAVRRVARIARRSGCGEDRRSDIEIAVHEAMANALQHGNGNGEPGRESMIFVRCYADSRGRLLIAIRDQGDGFEPSRIPDPRRSERRELINGRGLLLMRELSDLLAFRKGGREVVLYLDCRN